MSISIQRRVGLALLWTVLLLGIPGHAIAGDTFDWRRNSDRVDADIQSWNVPTLLEHVAAATGWHVYLDPGAVHDVSTKFTNQPPGEALRLLLGGLNYVIIPQTNGPSSLYVFRTSRQQATQLIAPPAHKTAQPIPNQLVVTLKPGSKVKIDDLAHALGAKVIGRMDAQNTYLLQFDDDRATQAGRTQLAANPDVQSVDSNFPVERPAPVDAALANASDLQLNPKTNTGPCQLVIGLIDMPVQSLGPKLDALIRPSISVAGGTTGATTLPRSLAITLSGQSADDSQAVPPTHGTAMAETILGALQAKTGGSTSVQIQPVDVYGNNETTTTFDVASGIVQAVNHGANIINLSLGSSGDSQLLHNTITQVSQMGIPIFAAAGNEPVTTPTYPAAYPEVVAVTASDSSGKIASYANRGSFVKMIAPGDNVVPFDGQNYLVEGTSTSTAFASGMAAGLADSGHVCADQAQALLQKSLKPFSALKP